MNEALRAPGTNGKISTADIIPYTSPARYNITVPWGTIEDHLDNFSKYTIIELDPEFQRAHVWTPEKQSAYIEFVLRGGRSALEIYFNCPLISGHYKDGNDPHAKTLYLVDGKQRMESVRAFLRDEVEVFGGYRFSDFTDPHAITGMGGPAFTWYINDLPKYSDLLKWYIDINAGGVAHTPEEIDKVRVMLKREIEPDKIKSMRL